MNLRHAMKRSKERRDFMAFKALYTTPGVTSIVMPANGFIGVSNSAGGALTVTVGGKVMTTPSLAANQVYNIGWVERYKTVVSASKVFVLDEWRRPFRILN